MAEIILWMVLAFAVFLLIFRWIVQWATGAITRHVHGTLSAAESIVERGELPEPWLRPYRQQIDDLRRKGGSQAQVEQVAQRAQRHCLRRIDELIKNFESGGFVNNPETRLVLIAELRKARVRWAHADWPAVLVE